MMVLRFFRKNKINISSEHAKVRELNNKERKKIGFTHSKIIRRQGKTSQSKGYSLGLSLANILYPKETVEIIATGYPNKRDTYSKKVELTKQSQKGIEHFYRWWNSKKNKINSQKKYYKHKSDSLYKAEIRADEIFNESGLKFNTSAMNIGQDKKRNIIFFELYRANIPKLKQFIEKMPKSLEKQQAQELMHAIVNMYPNEKDVYLHQEEKGERRTKKKLYKPF